MVDLEIKHDLPKEGQFVAISMLGGEIFSNTFRWEGSILLEKVNGDWILVRSDGSFPGHSYSRFITVK